MKKIFVILLLVLALSFSTTITSYSFDKGQYEPGDSGVLTLHITFNYGVEPTETLMDFSPVSVTASSALFSKKLNMPLVSPGEFIVTIPFKIPEDVREGQYDLGVVVTGTAEIWKGGSISRENDYARTILPLKVLKEPHVTVNTQTPVFHKRGNAVLEVCAQRSSVKDLRISSPQLYIGGGSLNVDKLDGCQNISFSYDASLLNEGNVGIPLILTYKTKLGDARNINLTLPITLSFDEARFTVSLDGALKSEGWTNVKLKITNNGGEVEDVRVYFPNSLVYNESELSLGSIEKEATIEKPLELYTPLSPTSTSLPITIKWKENGKEEEAIINVPVNVEGDSPVNVYLESSDTPLRKDGVYTLSAIVANKASYELSGVSIKMSSPWLDILNVEDEQFIGSLTDNDFSSQQFKVKIKSNAPNHLTVKISVEYRDPSGKEYNKTLIKEIRVYNAIEKSSDNSLLYIGIAVVVVGGAIYLWKRKK